MTSAADLTLLTAATLTGLQAGTYYTWASGVMPGLARTDDRTFVHAMQEMNVAIVNPVFLASFLGAPALACAAVAVSSPSARPWAIAGAALAIGTIAVTAFGNIPLNNALDAAGPVDQMRDPAPSVRRSRAGGSGSTRVRAVTSTVALGCLAVAALRS